MAEKQQEDKSKRMFKTAIARSRSKMKSLKVKKIKFLGTSTKLLRDMYDLKDSTKLRSFKRKNDLFNIPICK